VASRTYKPGLTIVTKALKRYVNDNQQKLQHNLSPEAYTLLLNLLEVADDLLALLGTVAPNP
jgi:hypothetical protein